LFYPENGAGGFYEVLLRTYKTVERNSCPCCNLVTVPTQLSQPRDLIKFNLLHPCTYNPNTVQWISKTQTLQQYSLHKLTNAHNKIQLNINHKIQFMKSIKLQHISAPENNP